MSRQNPTEDEIFRIALAISEPDARMAYLKQACRDEVEVERIVLLLREGSTDASFLEFGAVRQVPEPSTLALATLGLLGLAFYCWRRRR